MLERLTLPWYGLHEHTVTNVGFLSCLLSTYTSYIEFPPWNSKAKQYVVAVFDPSTVGEGLAPNLTGLVYRFDTLVFLLLK